MSKIVWAGMTPAEREFKHAVMSIVACKTYPSPRAIRRVLGRMSGQVHNINGVECRWRREVCKEIGFALRGKNL